MESVKERAGVSRGLAYIHFANAEELAFALYEREAAELDRRIAEAATQTGGFEDRVRAAMRAYLDFAGERGGLMALLQQKLVGRWTKPSALQSLSRRFDFWAKAIEKEAGVSEAVAGALARAAVASVEAFAMAWRMKKLSRRDAEDMSVAFALAGVRAAVGAKR